MVTTLSEAEIAVSKWIEDLHSHYQITKFAYEKSPARFTNKWLQDMRLHRLQVYSVNYLKALECKDILMQFYAAGIKAGICNGEIVIIK